MKAAGAPAGCPLGAWFLQRFMCALALALALAALLPVAAFAEALPDVSSGIFIDEASFPDPTFREYVQDLVGGDQLTQDAIDDITDIDVADQGIESLQGIEYFTALQWLNCENNRLTALDLSKNTALEHLQCNYNYLTGLDLEHNTNLVWSGMIAQLIPVDVSTSPSLDLKSLNPAIDPDKIKELEGAKLEGTTLSGMTAGTVATYAYGLNYYLPDGTGQAELHMEVVLELTNGASDLYLTDESLFPVSSDAFSLADDGTLVIKGSDTYTVRMVHNGQQSVRHAIEIAAGASPTVQLYNLDVQMQQGSCLVVEPGAGDVTLQLLGENRLESLAGGAGILKNNGNASLTIIGSSWSEADTLTAVGAEGYPGIGGAMLPSGDAECKNITIKGEIVTAQGGAGAAGIGTGQCSGNAVVSGITCDARGATITAEGGAGGAGIGSGLTGGNATVSDVRLADGLLYATGGAGAAGIGGGQSTGDSVLERLTVEYATVAAQGGAGGAGIGGGRSTAGDSTASAIAVVGNDQGVPSDAVRATSAGESRGLLKFDVAAMAGSEEAGCGGAAGIGGGSALQGTSRASDIVVYDASTGAYGSVLEQGAVLPAIGAGSGATRVSENIALNPLDECWITAWKGNSLEELNASEPFVRYESQRVSLDNLAEGCLKVEPDDSSALRCAGTDDGYSYDVGDLVITGSGTYTVSMNDAVIESEDGIVVAEGAEPTIVLDNVGADVSKWQEACALRIEEGAGDVTLLVKGENTLASGRGCSGIQKDSDHATLTIANLVGETAECSLVVSGGDVASIGGDYPEGARIVASDDWLATAWRGATDEEASRFLADAADPFDLTGIDDEYVKVAFSPKPSGGGSGDEADGDLGGDGFGSGDSAGDGFPSATTSAELVRTGDRAPAATLVACAASALVLALLARRRVR